MVTTRSQAFVFLAALTLAAFADPVRPQDGAKDALLSKGAAADEELSKVLKTHLTEGRARQILDQPLPAVLKKPLKDAATDDALGKLRKSRYNALLAMTADACTANGFDHEAVTSSRRFLDAGIAIYQKPHERLVFVEEMLELCTKMMARIEQRKKEAERTHGRLEWRIFSLEVEIELLNAKKAAKAER